MQRSVGVTAMLMLALGSGGLWMAAAGAQVDVQAFCQSRIDLVAAVAQQDADAAQVAVESLVANAPAELQEPGAALAALLAKRGPEAFETKKADKATDAIDKYVVANCGFPILDVSGIDYEFQGISGALTAGPYVIEFTNDAPAEHHEMVLARVEAGVNLSAKKLLALSKKPSTSRVAPVGAAFAEPGETDTLVVFLEPGRYVYACFIDVGTTSGADHGGGEHGGSEHGGAAEPHWKQGMRGELEVVGGA